LKTIVALLLLVGLAVPVMGRGVGQAHIITDIVRLSDVEVSLMILPDGSGTPFDDATAQYGGQIDASMELAIWNESGNLVTGLPASDFVLQSDDLTAGILQGCLTTTDHGLIPLEGTDDQGHLFFDEPLVGGGWSEGPLRMEIQGNSLIFPISDSSQGPVFDIRFNSPDINGDLMVNLSDIVLFTQDLEGEYHYRSDFRWDGVINLSDIVRMTQGLGVSCE